VFWILAVNVPPLVKEISKAKLFLTKPVMLFLSCMNSTFTHAAIVFEQIHVFHTLDMILITNTNLHFFDTKSNLFNGLNLVVKDQMVDLNQPDITENYFFSGSTEGTFWYRIKQ